MHVRNRGVTSLALGLVFVVVMQLPALASHAQRRLDGNDTPGRLDMERVTMRVTATRAVCRARFFEQIRSQDFASGGFYCSFDYYGTDDREDAFVRLYEDGGTIVAELWRRGASTFDYVRDVPGRINIVKDIAIVKVSRSEISGRPHFLKWRGVTHFYNGSSCSGGCSDYVPDTYGSWFRYRYH